MENDYQGVCRPRQIWFFYMYSNRTDFRPNERSSGKLSNLPKDVIYIHIAVYAFLNWMILTFISVSLKPLYWWHHNIDITSTKVRQWLIWNLIPLSVNQWCFIALSVLTYRYKSAPFADGDCQWLLTLHNEIRKLTLLLFVLTNG